MIGTLPLKFVENHSHLRYMNQGLTEVVTGLAGFIAFFPSRSPTFYFLFFKNLNKSENNPANPVNRLQVVDFKGHWKKEPCQFCGNLTGLAHSG